MGSSSSKTEDSNNNYNTLIAALVDAKNDESVFSAMNSYKDTLIAQSLLPDYFTDLVVLIMMLLMTAVVIYLYLTTKALAKNLEDHKKSCTKTSDRLVWVRVFKEYNNHQYKTINMILTQFIPIILAARVRILEDSIKLLLFYYYFFVWSLLNINYSFIIIIHHKIDCS